VFDCLRRPQSDPVLQLFPANRNPDILYGFHSCAHLADSHRENLFFKKWFSTRLNATFSYYIQFKPEGQIFGRPYE
jgi:hypothetical protein